MDFGFMDGLTFADQRLGPEVELRGVGVDDGEVVFVEADHEKNPPHHKRAVASNTKTKDPIPLCLTGSPSQEMLKITQMIAQITQMIAHAMKIP
jgi:hypothetical protein